MEPTLEKSLKRCTNSYVSSKMAHTNEVALDINQIMSDFHADEKHHLWLKHQPFPSLNGHNHPEKVHYSACMLPTVWAARNGGTRNSFAIGNSAHLSESGFASVMNNVAELLAKFVYVGGSFKRLFYLNTL